jgi:lipopolysaccharide/colanic/teichoic acid biosynthesis glycosyltransferase
MSRNRTLDLNELLKRSIDLVFSLVALMCLSPIIAVIALAIFLSDFHSPIFAGERVGMDGRLFKMLKFHSMQMGSDKIAPRQHR